MSYILDALKKAESERHPGAHPHLHAPPLLVTRQPSAPSLWRRTSTWLGLTAAAAALTALAWLKPWQTVPTAPAVVASAPAPQPPAPRIADAPAQPAPAAVAPAADAAPPQEAPSAPAKQKARPAAEKKSAKAATPSQARSARAPKPAPDVDAESRVAALHELPEHIRNEIPALSINGYLYSGNKADRTVLINKRLMHEGDQVAPGLTLEKLTPSGMVLNYKGYRYRTSY